MNIDYYLYEKVDGEEDKMLGQCYGNPPGMGAKVNLIDNINRQVNYYRVIDIEYKMNKRKEWSQHNLRNIDGGLSAVILELIESHPLKNNS